MYIIYKTLHNNGPIVQYTCVKYEISHRDYIWGDMSPPPPFSWENFKEIIESLLGEHSSTRMNHPELSDGLKYNRGEAEIIYTSNAFWGQ